MWKRKREDKEWWYPYATPEEAKDLDWNDAIIEYMNRVLLVSEHGILPLPELPWEGSIWMRDAVLQHEIAQKRRENCERR